VWVCVCVCVLIREGAVLETGWAIKNTKRKAALQILKVSVTPPNEMCVLSLCRHIHVAFFAKGGVCVCVCVCA